MLLSQHLACRDFVPWRFLDAGRLSGRTLSSCRRPKPAQEQTCALLAELAFAGQGLYSPAATSGADIDAAQGETLHPLLLYAGAHG
jgi:hypothetical protein